MISRNKLALSLFGCIVALSLSACFERRTEVVEERDHPRVIHERTIEVDPHEHDHAIER